MFFSRENKKINFLNESYKTLFIPFKNLNYEEISNFKEFFNEIPYELHPVVELSESDSDDSISFDESDDLIDTHQSKKTINNNLLYRSLISQNTIIDNNINDSEIEKKPIRNTVNNLIVQNLNYLKSQNKSPPSPPPSKKKSSKGNNRLTLKTQPKNFSEQNLIKKKLPDQENGNDLLNFFNILTKK